MKRAVVSKAVRDAFDRLMAAYPARGDNPRAPALVVFDRLVAQGDDAEQLVAAAGRFAAAMKAEAREARMIPHARTWLSQRRFEDYLSDVPASAPAGPSPEHPLFWMAAEIGDAAWMSYIGPLVLDRSGMTNRIEAPTQFALNRVRESWGKLIQARIGAVLWAVKS